MKARNLFSEEDLVMKYEISNGKIYGIDGEGRKIDGLSQEMGLVPQENVFFTDTIYNNIVLGNDISEKNLLKYVKNAVYTMI